MIEIIILVFIEILEKHNCYTFYPISFKILLNVNFLGFNEVIRSWLIQPTLYFKLCI